MSDPHFSVSELFPINWKSVDGTRCQYSDPFGIHLKLKAKADPLSVYIAENFPGKAQELSSCEEVSCQNEKHRQAILEIFNKLIDGGNLSTTVGIRLIFLSEATQQKMKQQLKSEDLRWFNRLVIEDIFIWPWFERWCREDKEAFETFLQWARCHFHNVALTRAYGDENLATTGIDFTIEELDREISGGKFSTTSHLVSRKDIADPIKFVDRLRDPSDPDSKKIVARLSDRASRELHRQPANQPSDALLDDLISATNQCLKKSDFVSTSDANTDVVIQANRDHLDVSFRGIIYPSHLIRPSDIVDPTKLVSRIKRKADAEAEKIYQRLPEQTKNEIERLSLNATPPDALIKDLITTLNECIQHAVFISGPVRTYRWEALKKDDIQSLLRLPYNILRDPWWALHISQILDSQICPAVSGQAELFHNNRGRVDACFEKIVAPQQFFGLYSDKHLESRNLDQFHWEGLRPLQSHIVFILGKRILDLRGRPTVDHYFCANDFEKPEEFGEQILNNNQNRFDFLRFILSRTIIQRLKTAAQDVDNQLSQFYDDDSDQHKRMRARFGPAMKGDQFKGILIEGLNVLLDNHSYSELEELFPEYLRRRPRGIPLGRPSLRGQRGSTEGDDGSEMIDLDDTPKRDLVDIVTTLAEPRQEYSPESASSVDSTGELREEEFEEPQSFEANAPTADDEHETEVEGDNPNENSEEKERNYFEDRFLKAFLELDNLRRMHNNEKQKAAVIEHTEFFLWKLVLERYHLEHIGEDLSCIELRGVIPKFDEPASKRIKAIEELLDKCNKGSKESNAYKDLREKWREFLLQNVYHGKNRNALDAILQKNRLGGELDPIVSGFFYKKPASKPPMRKKIYQKKKKDR